MEAINIVSWSLGRTVQLKQVPPTWQSSYRNAMVLFVIFKEG
jgi:hypothetical protein